MAKLTKKQKALASKVVPQKLYPVQEALALAKETAIAKFDAHIIRADGIPEPCANVLWGNISA